MSRPIAGPIAWLLIVFVCLVACQKDDVRDGPASTPALSAPPAATSFPSPVYAAPSVMTATDLGIRPTDCVVYATEKLRIASVGERGWRLTDGTREVALLDNKADAEMAVALAKRHKARCFIGRGNTRPNRNDYIVGYWTGNSGIATTIGPQEDCLTYRTTSLRIVNEGAKGWLLTDGASRMDILDSAQDANNALVLARRFSKQCFIGRGNNRPDRKAYIVEYWR
ncbi:MAG TPA: hypothetical protein VFC19_53095 [Candidatus Limnocylindrales bacterium]|nr:hypothetical protein [Candidatus Limnocylindrales bacterium]